MAYTKQEETNLNKQLLKWQELQLKAVRRNNIDIAFASMNDIERAVWEQVAKANTYKDVSVGAWELTDRVIRKYCNMAR